MSVAEYVYTNLLGAPPLKKCTNWMIRKIIPRELRYRNVILALNPQDPVISGALFFKVYERAEIGIYQRLLRPGMTVVDVGANIGLYSGVAARHVGTSGRVIAIEPDPETFQFLERTILRNRFRNVEAHQVAASDSAGKTRLFRNPDNRGDSRIYSDTLLQNSIEVSTVALDALLGEKDIRHVDVIKIDVQGAEGLVLAGARETLRRSPGLTIMMEFWPYGLHRTGHDPKALLQQLRDDGFRLFEPPAGMRPLRAEKDFTEIVARNQGRQYTNLLATKNSTLFPKP